ncbi:LuxR C-terminal-related transcriptional regulator [Streptomyces sp. NPDC015220]|uniref:helix-turn-helix transcriptional regulator n=1 Tax=Streptomyces sp. NPDC015220 TaxID=3364947 RepID=UPI0036F55F90
MRIHALRPHGGRDGVPEPAPVTIAVTASDLLTLEGARACLGAAEGVEVVPWEEREHAQLALVIAHEVTARTLARVGEVSGASDGGSPPVLLVADDIGERQLLEAVDRGVVGILLRAEVGYADILRAVHSSLDGESPMPPAMVRSLVDRLQSLQAAGRPEPGAALTSREVDVLGLLADGLSTAEVADRLNYSERTIKNVLHDVIVRLKLRNRTQAVAYAIRSGAL